mmetsp:Transcript_8754/g.8045  ORF Transcript_8754/g.8045 Transcript_8754/m.8045 type:complete len:204 (-) Transcript_8754:594-1205(-)
MPLLHVLAVETGNQGEDGVHVLHSLIQGQECFPVLDFFVGSLLRTGLFGLHLFDEVRQVVSVDLVPESALPGIKLHVDESDEIPHVLETDEFLFAVSELFVTGLLHVEEGLQVIQLLRLFLQSHRLVVVVTDRPISLIDDIRRRVLNVIRTVLLEVDSESVNLVGKVREGLLDVASFLGLQRQDRLLHCSQSLLTHFYHLRHL